MTAYDYDDYYYEQSEPLSDSCGGIAELMVGLVVGGILGAALLLIKRFDVLSSCLLGLLLCAFSYQNGNSGKINLIVFGVTILISLLLQHLWVGFKILYGIFACGAVAILANTIIGYETSTEMYRNLIISFIVTGVWGLFSWKALIAESN